MSEVYRIFSADWAHVLSYSDEMLIELFAAESYGGRTTSGNGFAVGKQYLNVHVKMWKEDIALGNLLVSELYEDDSFPRWWLDSVFARVLPG